MIFEIILSISVGLLCSSSTTLIPTMKQFGPSAILIVPMSVDA